MNRIATVRKRRTAMTAALALAVALGAAACGGDDGDSGGDSGKTYSFELVTHHTQEAALGQAVQWYADEVNERTDGRVTIKPHFAGSLVPGPEQLAAVVDGRADIGTVPTEYSPGTTPLSEIMQIPFLTQNPFASAGAMTDLYASNEGLQKEWSDAGAHVLLFMPVTNAVAGTKEPINSFDDLKGQRVRAAGGTATILDNIGVDLVELSGDQIYDALQRGVIDGYAAQTFDAAVSSGLAEVAPNTIDMGLGSFSGVPWVINEKKWTDLPSDIRDVMSEVATEFPEFISDTLETIDAESCTKLIDGGGEVAMMDQVEIDKLKDETGDLLVDKWKSTAGGDGDAFFDEFTTLLTENETKYDGFYTSGVERCVEEQG